jgi:hypothetical protein
MAVKTVLPAVVALAGLSAYLSDPPAGLAGPAPALTQVRVHAVRSTRSNQVWEYPSPYSFATPGDHAGPFLQVAVLETGYSSWRQAVFNGTPMRLVESIPQVNASRTVWGYIRVFQYDGAFASGSFSYQADSMVYPYRRLSTLFTIR